MWDRFSLLTTCLLLLLVLLLIIIKPKIEVTVRHLQGNIWAQFLEDSINVKCIHLEKHISLSEKKCVLLEL